MLLLSIYLSEYIRICRVTSVHITSIYRAIYQSEYIHIYVVTSVHITSIYLSIYVSLV